MAGVAIGSASGVAEASARRRNGAYRMKPAKPAKMAPAISGSALITLAASYAQAMRACNSMYRGTRSSINIWRGGAAICGAIAWRYRADAAPRQRRSRLSAGEKPGGGGEMKKLVKRKCILCEAAA